MPEPLIPFSYDSETHLIQPGLLTPPMVCASYSTTDGADGLVLKADGLELLRELLEDPRFEIVGANLPYDFAIACVERPELLRPVFEAYARDRIHDILTAQALIDIHAGQLFRDVKTGREMERYSQGYLEKLYLDVDRSADKITTKDLEEGKRQGVNSWRLRYARLEGVPLDQWPAEAVDYPKRDTRLALEIRNAQRAIGHNLHALGEQCRAAWALHLSAVWGMRTDPDMVPVVVGEIERKHQETMLRFKDPAIGIIRPDGTENQAELRRRVAVAYGAGAKCPTCAGTGKVKSEKTKNTINCKACAATGFDLDAAPIPRSDAGGVKADRDVLANSGDELLEAYAEAGANETLFSSFATVLAEGLEHPINPETNVLVNTGRSSYRGKLRQNFPRKGGIRDCFIPRPGHLFVSVDYSTLELCTLAQTNIWLQDFSRMAEAINAGKDLHVEFAAGVLATSYDELRAQVKAHVKQAKDGRQMAKAANFGLPGGLGAAAFVNYARIAYNARLCLLAGEAEVCGVEKVADRSGRMLCAKCVEVAKRLKAQWLATWEEMPGYFDLISQWTEGELGGSVQVLGPNPDDLGIVRGGCNFTAGANLPFQGLAARGAKAALFEVSREAYCDTCSPMFGTRPVIFIHDEILAEVPCEHAHEASERMAEVMIATMRRFVPDVRISAEPALMVRWLKGAETMRDALGKLLPAATCPHCGGITPADPATGRTCAEFQNGKPVPHTLPKDKGGGVCPGAVGAELCSTDRRTLCVA